MSLAKVFKKMVVTGVEPAAAVPVGERIDRDSGAVLPLEPTETALVLEGWEAKRRIDEAKADLERINTRLLEAYGPGCNLVVSGHCCATLKPGADTAKVTDAEKLQGVLGGRFGDMVETTCSYKPLPPLLKIAVDADSPIAPLVHECVSVFTGKESVSWRAAR